tara:strand:+ start:762 stop:1514 length:753 start_codon:yes stop_codon:yes gene_type:complete
MSKITILPKQDTPEFTMIDFAISSFCQAKCRSCARTNDETGDKEDWLVPKHMKLETFKNVIGNMKAPLVAIQFCGELGDPMMHPQIEEFIDVALNKLVENKIRLQLDEQLQPSGPRPTLVISTNGGLRDPEFYTRIGNKYNNNPISKKIVDIHFGIDGMDHDTNWLYREGVDWQRAMDNMNAWLNTNNNTTWWFLIFSWNWKQIPMAYEYATKNKIKIEFKFNNRDFGLISDQDKQEAYEILKNLGVDSE